MNIELLNSIVEKLIVKKYPWIKSFRWESFVSGTWEHWTLYITVDRNFLKGQEGKLGQIRKELALEVSSLFEMLGPKPHERFSYVYIE